MCACRGCYLLFTSEGAGGGHFRAVPDRYLAFTDFRLSRGAVGQPADPGQRRVLLRQLDARSGRRVLSRARPGRPSRCSRSTCGTSSSPPTRRSPRSSPTSRRLLVRADRESDGAECFLVPIDACYELVGHLRRLWRGFDGGQRGARRARRVLRPGPSEGAMTSLDVRGDRAPGRSRTRPCRRSMLRLAHRRARRARPVHAVALQVPDPHRAAAAPLRARRGGAPRTSCSARRRSGATRCARSSGPTCRRRSPRSRVDRGRPARRRAPTTSRSPPSKYLHASKTAWSPSCCCSPGPSFTVEDGRLRVEPVVVGPRRHVPPAGRHLAGRRWTSTSPTADGSASAARPSTRCTRFKAERALPTWDLALEQLLKEAGEAVVNRTTTDPTASTPRERWPMPCSTRGTSCTRTGRRRRRTRCAGSSAWRFLRRTPTADASERCATVARSDRRPGRPSRVLSGRVRFLRCCGARSTRLVRARGRGTRARSTRSTWSPSACCRWPTRSRSTEFHVDGVEETDSAGVEGGVLRGRRARRRRRHRGPTGRPGWHL